MSSIVATPVDKNKRWVVLGATGRLGRLIRSFWPERAVKWQSRTPKAGFETVDILNDPAGLARLLHDADVVLCLAGITPAPDANMALNVSLARATLDAAHAVGQPRVLLASSGAVYGPGPWTENGPTAPLSPYGKAKRDMEVMAANHPHAAHTSCLRIGNVVGADAILGKWQTGMQLDQLADGRAPKRSYIGPQTLANVFERLGAASNLPPLINIAAPGVIGMDDLLDAAALSYEYRTPHPGVIPKVSLCTKRLEARVPFSPNDSMAETMVTQWRRAQGAQ